MYPPKTLKTRGQGRGQEEAEREAVKKLSLYLLSVPLDLLLSFSQPLAGPLPQLLLGFFLGQYLRCAISPLLYDDSFGVAKNEPM